jgi:hypothetical protein
MRLEVAMCDELKRCPIPGCGKRGVIAGFSPPTSAHCEDALCLMGDDNAITVDAWEALPRLEDYNLYCHCCRKVIDAGTVLKTDNHGFVLCPFCNERLYRE